jgi:hypothetical protein
MASPTYNAVAQDERAGHPIEGAIASIVADGLEVLTGCYPSEEATLTVTVSAGTVDAQEVDADALLFTAPVATEFRISLGVVNPATGAITEIEGSDTSDQQIGSAVAPALTGDLVELFRVTIDATDIEAGSIDQSSRGAGLDTTQTLAVTITTGLILGVDIDEATVTVSASSASNFAKDLVSVNPSTGALTVTAGTEAASAGAAVIPDVPADGVALVAITVGNVATGITVIDSTVRGLTPPTVG